MRGMDLLYIEGKKLKRSKILWILIAAVAVLWIPCVLNADVNFSMQKEGISPEDNFFVQGFMGFVWFLFPASMTVAAVLITQTERGGRGILKMLSLPVNTGALCLAKFVMMLLLLAVEMAVMTGAYFLAAAAASHFENYSFAVPAPMVFQTAGLLFAASLPMAAFYYMLSICVRTSVFSVGIGLATIVPSVLVMNTKAWFLYPMCYPFRVITAKMHELAANMGSFDYELVPWIPAAAAIGAACLAAACLCFGKAERR